MKNDFAPGLPSKEKVHSINQSGLSRLVIQEHNASNHHYDVRLHDGEVSHSWASKYYPFDKDRSLLIRQPTHRTSYSDFEGKIESGYGAGTVKKVYDSNVDVIHGSNEKVKFVVPEGEFTAIHTHDKNWLLVKQKPFEGKINYKPSLKEKSADEIDYKDQLKVLQPKVDGAHSLIELNAGNKPNRIYSYRTSVKTGLPIEHTHQVPVLRDLNIPKELDGTILRADLFALDPRTSKPIPAADVGGLLNMETFKSRFAQQFRGELQPFIHDIVKYKGKDVENEIYAKKLAMLHDVGEKTGLHIAETAWTPEAKKKLIEKIKNEKHPLTREGVVEWDIAKPGGDPKKIKFKDTHEVYIRDIFKAQSKLGRQIAGGFKYSLTPEGPIVGKVGTGFKELMRQDMLKHPENYTGKVARVNSQEQFPSGALRAPSFYSLHVEKNL